MEGDWLVDFDPSQYSAQELKEMLALPKLPTGYSKVIIPAGTQMRTRIVNAIKSWGKGGAQQFQIMDGWEKAGADFQNLGTLK